MNGLDSVVRAEWAMEPNGLDEIMRRAQLVEDISVATLEAAEPDQGRIVMNTTLPSSKVIPKASESVPT